MPETPVTIERLVALEWLVAKLAATMFRNSPTGKAAIEGWLDEAAGLPIDVTEDSDAADPARASLERVSYAISELIAMVEYEMKRGRER